MIPVTKAAKFFIFTNLEPISDTDAVLLTALPGFVNTFFSGTVQAKHHFPGDAATDPSGGIGWIRIPPRSCRFICAFRENRLIVHDANGKTLKFCILQ